MTDNDLKKIVGILNIVGIMIEMANQIKQAVEADETLDPTVRAAIRSGYAGLIAEREAEQARLDKKQIGG